MIIEVNCNDDTLRVRTKNIDKTCKLSATYRISELLKEVFDLLDEDAVGLDLQLLRIDEDTRTIIGEW